MSNTLAPFGARYTNRVDGAEPNYQISTAPIYYTNPNTIGYGDVVKTVTSGANQGTLDIAGTGSQVAGVFIGCSYVDSVLGYVERPSWSAPSTAVSGSVVGKYIPDVNAVFEMQVGNFTSAITQTSIGLNIGIGGLGTPNSAGYSIAYADGSTIGTTTVLPFRIIGYGTGVNNDPTSANPVLRLVLNNCDLNSRAGV